MWKQFIQKITGAFPVLGDIFQLANAGVSFAKGLGEEKRQKRLMDYQDQINDANYQKELADKERLIAEDREYNNASNTMARARQAGVSPLAALGVSSGNSISATAPDTGTVSQPNDNSAQHFGNAMQMIVSSQELKNARERLKFEKEESKQRAEREKAQADKLKAEKVYQDILNANIDEKLKEELNNLVAQGKVLEAEKKLKEAQAVSTTDDNTRKWQMFDLSKDEKRAIINNLKANARVHNADAVMKEVDKLYYDTYGTHLPDSSIGGQLSRLVNALTGETGSPTADLEDIENDNSRGEWKRVKQFWFLVQKMGITPVVASILYELFHAEEVG